jgi:hypothetical protein
MVTGNSTEIWRVETEEVVGFNGSSGGDWFLSFNNGRGGRKEKTLWHFFLFSSLSFFFNFFWWNDDTWHMIDLRAYMHWKSPTFRGITLEKSDPKFILFMSVDILLVNKNTRILYTWIHIDYWDLGAMEICFYRESGVRVLKLSVLNCESNIRTNELLISLVWFDF